MGDFIGYLGFAAVLAFIVYKVATRMLKMDAPLHGFGIWARIKLWIKDKLREPFGG